MQQLQVNELTPYLQDLVALLIDCVDDGASIGFIPPLARDEALQYWQAVEQSLATPERAMLIALDDQQQLLGTIQLSMTAKPNGHHRAEVEKLMVHTRARGQGIGKALILAAEPLAVKHGRHLMVLDTRLGDVASALYRRVGYQEAGQIPGFALNGEGTYDATVYFYKHLSTASKEA
ncbi:GNAT family N-acetyltransferase [Corallincola luteus]|uniref:GNAT family N-acetyltransferase n=1 Tax=Corallincola luteus TaxID=1775177 RepID=A0ABY2ANE4_9GAMM|nr:GNAT family N-acetyltransferase [Corallincola luteus]TCI04728.1 GNAT family N-acetyltransferase [Corallincola luteus]